MILAVIANTLGVLPRNSGTRSPPARSRLRHRPIMPPRPMPGAHDTVEAESARILLAVTWAVLF